MTQTGGYQHLSKDDPSETCIRMFLSDRLESQGMPVSGLVLPICRTSPSTFLFLLGRAHVTITSLEHPFARNGFWVVG
jgi:hypothetical protein